MQSDEIECKLKEDKLGENLYRPNYAGLGLVNLTSSILLMLGCKWQGPSPLSKSLYPLDQSYDNVVLILVDALGWNLLKRSKETLTGLGELVERHQPLPITSVFPSTTSTVLTTVSTGSSPARHGIVGYSMYIKELGAICNMLDFKIINASRDESIFEKGLDVADLLGLPTIYQKVSAQGIVPYILTKNHLINSGLSRATHTGANTVGYVDVGDMFVLLRKLLERNTNQSKYIFAYWPSVDTASHNYGPWTDETMAEVRSFFFSLRYEFLSRIGSEIKKDTLIIITGDHGHSAIYNDGVYDVSTDSRMMDMLTMPPIGDPRASFFHLKKIDTDEAVEYMESKFDGSFYFLDIKQLEKTGLLGPDSLKHGLIDRLGDLLVLPDRGKAIFYPFKNEKVFTQKGSHAGLTDDELFVPLLAIDF